MEALNPYYEPRLAYRRSTRYHKRYSNRGTLSISSYKRAVIALLIVASATLVGTLIVQRDISAKHNQIEKLEAQKKQIELRLKSTSSDKSKLEQDTKSYQDQIKSKDEQIQKLNSDLQAKAASRSLLVSTAYAAEPAPQGDIQGIIVAAAHEFGVDPSWLLRIAKCESGFNPNAKNPSGASGLFQFMPSTFAANAPRAGAGNNIWSATDSARTAAYMFSIGQSGQWVCN